MSYEKQNWTSGDTITAEKLNHMEDGIVEVSEKEASKSTLPVLYCTQMATSQNTVFLDEDCTILATKDKMPSWVAGFVTLFASDSNYLSLFTPFVSASVIPDNENGDKLRYVISYHYNTSSPRIYIDITDIGNQFVFESTDGGDAM